MAIRQLASAAGTRDAATAAATPGKFINLGPQVTSHSYQASAFTTDPAGRTLLCAVIRSQPAAKLLIFDLAEARLIRSIPLPGANGAWGAVTASDASVYIATENNGKLFRYIPASHELRDLGQALPDQTFLWHLARGGDSADVFGCTYPGCRAFRYAPDSGFEDLTRGPVVPGELYARAVAYDPASSTLYVGVGVRPHLLEIDLKTGHRREILPPDCSDAQTAYSLSLVGPRLFVMLYPQQRTIVMDRSTLRVEASFPTLGLHQLTSDASPHDGSVYYVHDGQLMRFEPGGSSPPQAVLPCAEPLAFAWISFDGDTADELLVFGKDGQLVRHHPPTGRSSARRLHAPEEPARIQSIFPGPDGRVWAGGYLAGSVAAFDPATGRTARYKGFTQTEAGSPLGRTLYFGVYPHCHFYALDTTQPWDAPGGNPRRIGQLLDHDQSRPVAVLGVEPLQKVYIGNVPEYGLLGGGLGIYHAATDRLECRRNVVADQSIVSLVYVNGLLIGGTSVSGGLGIQPSQPEAKLFVWDPVIDEMVFQTTVVPGKPIVSGLALGPDGNVWGIAAGVLFAFDLTSRQTVFRKELTTKDYSSRVLWQDAYLVAHQNGRLYATADGRLFRIDTADRSIAVLKENGPDLLTAGPDGKLYFAQGTDLWQYVP